MTESRININANDNQGVQNLLGTISGNIQNTIEHLPDSPQVDKPGIKELLAQLKQEIEINPNLNHKQKEKALKQLGKLAEAGRKSNPTERQEEADDAIVMLKGLLSGLPSTLKLLELLPEVAKLFGLG
mgnify:FL=1